MASSTISGQGSGAMGHTPSAVRRASFSLFAQHTVTCAYLGFFLPPDELNVLIVFSSAPTVINPSPMRVSPWMVVVRDEGKSESGSFGTLCEPNQFGRRLLFARQKVTDLNHKTPSPFLDFFEK